MDNQELPYGLWPSPISTGMVSQRLGQQDVQWNSDGKTLVWLESQSDRNRLIAKAAGDARQVLTTDQNVRAGVGYGGGDFTIAQDQLIFAERSGRLFARSLGYSQPRPITPPFGYAAAPALSPDGKWVLYVHSDGSTDVLSVVDANGLEWPYKIAHGADFYMQPVWHPAGTHIAWVEWDHPNMPWDGTRLLLGRLEGTPPHISERQILAGDEDHPVSQPAFSPDGRWLSYITTSGEWEKLILVDLQSGQSSTLVEGEGLVLSLPAWLQGVRNYGWNYTSQRLFYTRFSAGYATLWSVELDSRESYQLDTGPYTWIAQISVSPTSDEVAFLASAPTVPNRVMHWDGERMQVVARSEPENVSPNYLPDPVAVTWKAPDGMSVHGLYYPPQHPQYTADGLPPAIINIHGGPTSATPARYNPETVYFTSRGYGWMEVNYRGSTGYGRSYQLALRQRWGLVDVEDAIGAMEALAERGMADPKRMVISGGSAGGYTVLNALVHFPGRFKAGICRYGVSDLYALAMETHKFEAHYNDSLVGVLPEAAERYHAWSPIFHAGQIRDPLAIFQGSADKVVPPSQSEKIVEVLRKNQVPHLYRLYEGEGHGFRNSENIADYLQQTERFLQQHVLFAP